MALALVLSHLNVASLYRYMYITLLYNTLHTLLLKTEIPANSHSLMQSPGLDINFLVFHVDSVFRNLHILATES